MRPCNSTSKIRPHADIPAGRCHEAGQPEIMGSAESLQPELWRQIQLWQRGCREDMTTGVKKVNDPRLISSTLWMEDEDELDPETSDMSG